MLINCSAFSISHWLPNDDDYVRFGISEQKGRFLNPLVGFADLDLLVFREPLVFQNICTTTKNAMYGVQRATSFGKLENGVVRTNVQRVLAAMTEDEFDRCQEIARPPLKNKYTPLPAVKEEPPAVNKDPEGDFEASQEKSIGTVDSTEVYKFGKPNRLLMNRIGCLSQSELLLLAYNRVTHISDYNELTRKQLKKFGLGPKITAISAELDAISDSSDESSGEENNARKPGFDNARMKREDSVMLEKVKESSVIDLTIALL